MSTNTVESKASKMSNAKLDYLADKNINCFNNLFTVL